MLPIILSKCGQVGHQLLPNHCSPWMRRALLSSCHVLLKNEDVVPSNPLAEFHSSGQQSSKGLVYETKPFKIECKEGKVYFWCLCGRSKNQPFCDGTHKNPHMRITLKPLRFTVSETKDYWLCNCKQTSCRPFCDGTHKTLDPASATRR